MKTTRPTESHERVFLVGVGIKRISHVPGVDAGDAERASLEELAELARSAGAQVAGCVFQMRDKIDPATVIGRGKIDEVKIEANLRHAPLIIFDRNLSPTQLRNLEKGTECRVIDRTQLILDIFARHARSREGQLQVELAQLNYSLPRLAGSAKALSRQAGGIGTRGPGEQKLETDRRRIRDRISKITKAIEAVRKQRSLRRETRQAVPLGTVALVGYTNAGKSTLFNALSKAGVLVSSKMFATLDPTVRAVRLPSNRRILLSDTVGFIRDLPPGLIAAFRATLEEVQESALILLVTDISNPHHTEQDEEVEKILKGLGVGDRPRLHVLNKIDQLSPEEAAAGNGNRNSARVSGLTGQGLDDLLKRIDEKIPIDPVLRLHFTLPLSDGRSIALVHALGRVLHSEVQDSEMSFDAEIPESVARQLKIGPQPVPAA
jgi:GTP-binding protein HflX